MKQIYGLEESIDIPKDILRELLNDELNKIKLEKEPKFNEEQYKKYLKYKEKIEPLIIPSIN